MIRRIFSSWIQRIIKKKMIVEMSQPILNDYKYTPKQLRQIEPDPNYKVDEADLKKSNEKNRKLITEIRELRKQKGL